MENQALFEKVLQTFDNNDSDGLIALVTDDFEWQMLGDQTIKGKDQLEKLFADTGNTEMVGCTKEMKILEGNKAACNGIVTMKNGNGDEFEMYYCDLFEFENGRLKKIVTYNLKKE